MENAALQGGFADPARDAARAFRAAMEAIARPGTIQVMTGCSAPAPLSGAAATLLATLCDTETPLHLAGACDTGEVRDWVQFHLGAPLVGRAEAMFAVGAWEALLPLDDYAVGTAQYPDRSATLIVEMVALSHHGVTLTGPGIAQTAQLSLPAGLLAARIARFPLGLDFILACGDRVAALPRTTKGFV
jgi:alpha-D-ribose 1-methylphosphonate 5-triphosphate synthase subunit PhnH